MKKGFLIFLIFFGFLITKAQETVPVKKIDTVKTEVVEVITTYNPEIADANKIKKNPIIKLSDKSKKKKLTYNIFSAPVASTFIPKSGVVKGVDVGVKERIYNNYIAAGFGNYTSPYLEAYINNSTRFEGNGHFAKSTVHGNIAQSRITVIEPNANNVKPVEQVVAKQFFLYQLFQILVGGSNDSNIYFYGCVPAYAIKLAIG